jgi:uncharacterized protein YpmB
MNEVFEFHKTLNKKKIAMLIIIIILILLLIVFSIERHIENKKKFDEANASSVTFFDKNNELSIELSKKYDLSLVNLQENNYVLELSSPNKLYICVSKEDLISNHNLSNIVESDKSIFTEKFSNVSDISDISETTINDLQSYTYGFNYIDSETSNPFYLQTLWIQTESNYYIVDVSFIQNDSQDYNNVFNDIISNLKIEN